MQLLSFYNPPPLDVRFCCYLRKIDEQKKLISNKPTVYHGRNFTYGYEMKAN